MESLKQVAFFSVHTLFTLVVSLYCIGNFLQNILGCYSETKQDSETNDTSFESPIIEPLELVMKAGMAVS